MLVSVYFYFYLYPNQSMPEVIEQLDDDNGEPISRTEFHTASRHRPSKRPRSRPSAAAPLRPSRMPDFGYGAVDEDQDDMDPLGEVSPSGVADANSSYPVPMDSLYHPAPIMPPPATSEVITIVDELDNLQYRYEGVGFENTKQRSLNLEDLQESDDEEEEKEQQELYFLNVQRRRR